MSEMATSLAQSQRTSPGRLVNGAGRPSDVVAFEQAMVRFFVESADLLGIPKSVAAIYAIYFASHEPLGYSEIQRRLNMSAGSVSQGVRVLRDVGALKLADTREGAGSKSARSTETRRRDLYEPDLELRNLVSRFLRDRLQAQLEGGRGRLQALADAIPVGGNQATAIRRERLKILQTWHEKSRALLPVMRAFLKLT